MLNISRSINLFTSETTGLCNEALYFSINADRLPYNEGILASTILRKLSTISLENTNITNTIFFFFFSEILKIELRLIINIIFL